MIGSKARSSHTDCGTEEYMAPEVWHALESQGVKADLWSLGIILFKQLKNGVHPFGDNPTYIQQNIVIDYSTFKLPEVDAEEKGRDLQGLGEYREIIHNLLCREPERWSAKELLESETMKTLIQRNLFDTNILIR